MSIKVIPQSCVLMVSSVVVSVVVSVGGGGHCCSIDLVLSLRITACVYVAALSS